LTYPWPQAVDWADELDIPLATNAINDILLDKDVDLVCIATPPLLHADVAIKAINAGKHVICEKPAGAYSDAMVTLLLFVASPYCGHASSSDPYATAKI
jgi:hypothetical protein